MDDKEMFRNNLILLRKQKIPRICALNGIAGLNALCRIFNQSILKSGRNDMLANKHYCVQLSMRDICKQMRKPAQKKYSYYQKGTEKINDGLLRHDIRMLIIAEVVRKVDFTDLTPYEQKNIVDEKQNFNDGKITDNPYVSAPYYEVLDLNNCHLERLTKIKNKDISSYVIVQQMFNDQIANNCFNSTIRNYKSGFNGFGDGSFYQIVEIIKKDKVVSLKDLSDYCAQKIPLYALYNGEYSEDYKSQAWWHKQLREFDFSQEGIVICHNSELSKKKKLDIRGNSLVLVG